MNTKRNNVKDDDVVTTVRLPREQHERLKELAAREHRSFGQQVRFLLEAATRDPQDTEAAA